MQFTQRIGKYNISYEDYFEGEGMQFVVWSRNTLLLTSVHLLFNHKWSSPIDVRCRIGWLHLYREVRQLSPEECPGYDNKLHMMVSPGALEMQSITLLQLLPGLIWLGLEPPKWVKSMGQIELFNHLLDVKQSVGKHLNFHHTMCESTCDTHQPLTRVITQFR